ncbi:MAG TPA: hypothetical protein VKX49_26325 [Bryobacteraceae bacterium]|jgi:hypothetical protein|nr:hypothetical protein [Bryobacteraceae bacterium]
MNFNGVLSVSALVLAMIPARAANGPSYNPATAVAISGTVAGVRVVPPGQPLEGVHMAVKTKTRTVEVYLAPKNFLDFLKANYVPGDEVEITGSRVKSGNTDVLLAREIDDGRDVIDLRDLNGAPVWEHWGVEADPASIH